LSTDICTDDIFSELEKIKEGSVIYKVVGMTAPEELGGKKVTIGNIVSTSETTRSMWGDQHLYFRHQRADEDIAMEPKWEQYYPKFVNPAKVDLAEVKDSLVELAKEKCPFSFLW